jgi:hypothetical protein
MRAPAAVLVLLASLPAAAQDGAGWCFRGDAGWGEMHSSPDRGPSRSLRLGRAFGSIRSFSVDAGINAALADEGFVSGVVGMELRAWPGRRLSPFLRLEGGALLEESQSYVVLGAGRRPGPASSSEPLVAGERGSGGDVRWSNAGRTAGASSSPPRSPA